MRARQHSLSIWLGYDPSVLARLSPTARAQIARYAESWLFCAFCLSLPLGYAFFLLTHQLWVSATASLGTGVFLVNLLRLSVAGGGAAASDSESAVRARSPSLAPVVWFALLGVLFAQPAQLVFWRAELDPLVAESRGKLAVQHLVAISALRAEEKALGERARTDHYAEELSHCEFLVLRLRGVWREPVAATRLSLLFLAIVLLPALVARAHARIGLREYELARWRIQRGVIARHAKTNHALVMSALSPFATYVPRGYRDPFESTRPDALTMAWPLVQDRKLSLAARAMRSWRRGGRT